MVSVCLSILARFINFFITLLTKNRAAEMTIIKACNVFDNLGYMSNNADCYPDHLRNATSLQQKYIHPWNFYFLNLVQLLYKYKPFYFLS